MPIGLGPPRGHNFRAGYLRSALGAIDRRRDLQRSIDALLNDDQEVIDLGRLRELISAGQNEISAECRQTVWALLLGVLPPARPLWFFVSTQLDHRYLDLSEAAKVLMATETERQNSADRMRSAVKIVNEIERVDNSVPIQDSVLKIFASVFPDSEAFAFFMYCSYIRSTHDAFTNLSASVFDFCELIDISLRNGLDQTKTKLQTMVQRWIDSCFVSAKLFGSLLPIWERLVLLQGTQFAISVCLALLSCAREVIIQSKTPVESILTSVEAYIQGRPVEVIYAKALELDAALSRSILLGAPKKREFIVHCM